MDMENGEGRDGKFKNKYYCGHHHHQAASGMWFLGFVGAAVYYLQNATTFPTGLLGLLKAIVWPAMLVYKLLAFLGM